MAREVIKNDRCVFNTSRTYFTPGICSRETLRKSNTQFPFKKCISRGLDDWQPNPVLCMTIPLVDIQISKGIDILYTVYISV